MPRSLLDKEVKPAVAALTFSGYLALVATDSYEASILALPVLLFALIRPTEQADARFKLYREFTTVVALVLATLLILSVPTLGLLTAVTLLVMFIQAYKLLHQKNQRDYYQIVLMAFFMLICATAAAPGPLIGPVFLLFSLSAAWTLLVLDVRRAQIAVHESSAGETVSTATTWACYAPSKGGSSSSEPVRPRLSQLAVLAPATATALACIAVGLGLFFLTPRLDAGVFGGTGTGPATTGVDGTIDLARAGAIQPNQTPVMMVRFPDQPDGKYPGGLYWRVTSLDTFIASSWERTGVSERFADDTGMPKFLRRGADAITRTAWNAPVATVKQEVFLDNIPRDGLPVMPFVRELESKGTNVAWDPLKDYTVRLVENAGAIHYEAVSDVPSATPEMLRNARDDYHNVMPARHLFVLTQNPLNREARALAQSLAQDAPTVYDKVLAVQNWLSGEDFIYTLNVPAPGGDRPVENFLLRSRRGHCELFASAMALMLRSLGIPARVAKGYLGGDWNEQDRSYEVRQAMAHLWVEVYFIDYGWIIFDPSPPPASTLNQQGGGFMRELQAAMLRIRMAWYRDIVGYNGEMQWHNAGRFLASTAGVLVATLNPFSDSAAPGRPATVVALLIVLPLIVAAYVLYRRFQPLRGAVPGLTRDQMRARDLFRRTQRRLSRFGAPSQGKTTGEILQDLELTDRLPTEPIREIIRVYNRCRFGGAPLSSSEHRRLRSLLRDWRPETG